MIWPHPYGEKVSFMNGSSGYVSAGVRAPWRNTCKCEINESYGSTTKELNCWLKLILSLWIVCRTYWTCFYIYKWAERQTATNISFRTMAVVIHISVAHKKSHNHGMMTLFHFALCTQKTICVTFGMCINLLHRCLSVLHNSTSNNIQPLNGLYSKNE